MGGKSVFLKQTALIVILAQMGSFVPAASARVALVDRIFTRVGASDNLARGRSTFMVEMTETARILNTATPRSLILLDEVGRGTSTFDGLSLAWAIAEFIHDSSEHAAKTLFATHYHEMTELAKMRPGVRNYQVAVSESAGEIVFLRRVVPGSASKSYGIEVARLAGLPMAVVERAREILLNLEQNELDLDREAQVCSASEKAKRALPSTVSSGQFRGAILSTPQADPALTRGTGRDKPCPYNVVAKYYVGEKECRGRACPCPPGAVRRRDSLASFCCED